MNGSVKKSQSFQSIIASRSSFQTPFTSITRSLVSQLDRERVLLDVLYPSESKKEVSTAEKASLIIDENVNVFLSLALFFSLFSLSTSTNLSLRHTKKTLQQESLASPIDRRSDYYRRVAACEQCGNSITVPASPPPSSQRRRSSNLGGGGESDSAAAPAVAPDEQVVHRREALLTAPNVLTLFRLALVPVFFALWFVEHGDAAWAPPAAAAIFAAAVRGDSEFFFASRRSLSLVSCTSLLASSSSFQLTRLQSHESLARISRIRKTLGGHRLARRLPRPATRAHVGVRCLPRPRRRQNHGLHRFGFDGSGPTGAPGQCGTVAARRRHRLQGDHDVGAARVGGCF